MQLNPDCLRDVLLVVEKTTTSSTMCGTEDLVSAGLFEKYSQDEVDYHVRQAEWSGLLVKVTWFLGGNYLIQDLSPAGHEFLANIRSDNNWNKTKSVAAKVGSTSINALTTIAGNVVTSLIQQAMHLN